MASGKVSCSSANVSPHATAVGSRERLRAVTCTKMHTGKVAARTCDRTSHLCEETMFYSSMEVVLVALSGFLSYVGRRLGFAAWTCRVEIHSVGSVQTRLELFITHETEQ